MFMLTKKTDYAIIALSHLAQRPAEVCKSREIAEKYRVPAALLTNVLKTLAQKELIRSIRGAKGGYTLAMPAERITLDAILAMPAERITLDAIIHAIEGPVQFVQCALDSPKGESLCELTDVCPVTMPVKKVHAKLKAFLVAVTLSDIVHDPSYGEHVVPIGVLAADGGRTDIGDCGHF